MRRLLVLFTLAFCNVVALAADPLVVYSGRGEASVGPLLEKFQEETGVELDIRYNSTPALATQVLNEGEYTPADVVFFQESGYLGVLAAAGLLATIDDEYLDRVNPQFRDPDGQWLGTSGRMRVLVYNTDKFTEADMPKSLEGLTDSQWQQRLGWAPSNASAQAHMTALRLLWGEEKLRDWLAAIRDNQALSYPRNAQIVTAVGNGEIDIGWANHYYAHRLKEQNPNLAVANYYFPEEGKDGNLFIISGVGVIENTKNLADAQKLLDFLTSESAQDYFTNHMFEYPTRDGITANADLVDLSELELVEISQTDLADVSPTIVILQDLNIL